MQQASAGYLCDLGTFGEIKSSWVKPAAFSLKNAKKDAPIPQDRGVSCWHLPLAKRSFNYRARWTLPERKHRVQA